ncbi:orotate phosphoribosyltransferase [Candidatus Woesearchaeota archaeon]|nr:orotate phosphoribosyltransferase [Candidatus Woesearchaeota archaeon]|tara:strand:- start:7962 stop:8618 length:657 start_codon:yes stop_codon:yes gene_type:complete
MAKEKEIAKILLEKKAVTLNTKEPYTYVSGIRSPIYCDNRVMTFFPEQRKMISNAFNEIVEGLEPDVIAGTASSAISWAAWVSQRLSKPMVYIRKKTKDYGKEKLIEGGDVNGKRVVVIEDLVSTGGSSLNAVNACKGAGAEVIAMVAIFTYEFEKARKSFEEAGCKAVFLTNFSTLANVAKEMNHLNEDELKVALEWNKAPSEWGPKHGFANAEGKS